MAELQDVQGCFGALGIRVPEIYLPAGGVDPGTWAVVACDQYSSEREYWEAAAEKVGTKPSTLNLIFPECYLEDSDKEARIASIQAAMKEYLSRGYLKSIGPGFVLVERKTTYEPVPRVGLMISVDLEKYVYGADSRSLIRPTEGTIVERLPPRMAIRRGAPLELPHIMVLMDDPARSVLEPLYARRNYLAKLYDFDLMSNSGHVTGWRVSDPALLETLCAALKPLSDPAAFEKKYGTRDLLLFAVGDGNHSLATAKAIWEEVKASLRGRPDEARLLGEHPARFALVELLNIYDEGLPFHPIHRVLFKVDGKKFFETLRAAGASLERCSTAREAFDLCDRSADKPGHTIAFTRSGEAGLIRFEAPSATLAAGTIQAILDPYLKANPETGIDYIHGEGSLEALAGRPGNLGLYLPPVDKASFFATVIRNGAMPRKTFSMGEAPEKRFYMESRRISL